MREVMLKDYFDINDFELEVVVNSADGFEVYQGKIKDYYSHSNEAVVKATQNLDILNTDVTDDGRVIIRLNAEHEDMVFYGKQEILEDAFATAEALAEKLQDGVQLHELADELENNRYAQMYQRLVRLAQLYVEETK